MRALKRGRKAPLIKKVPLALKGEGSGEWV
jgi:hypothetical protein